MRDLQYLFMMNFNYVVRTPSTDQANTYGDTLGDAYDTDQPVSISLITTSGVVASKDSCISVANPVQRY